jgi:fermentation-respiration switch protein FrsA (DUF1100 family)
MSLPQFTVRRVVVAVAVVAGLVGAEMIRRRSGVYRERLAHHSAQRSLLSAQREIRLREAEADPAMRAVHLFDAERHRLAIAWHAQRESLDRRAMWQPWQPSPADLREPPWPRIPPELYPVTTPHPPTDPDRRPTSLVDSFLFHPWRYPRGRWEIDDATIEDVWFRSPDGVRLNGWFAAAERPRAVVLYAEGNAGNITGRRWVLDLFRDRMRASVLIFDYRGYGRSEGSPSQAGALSDARAARHWLAGRAGVAEGDIVLVGHSLGGAVVVDLAARDGARGLVLENTLSSLADVTERHFGRLARLLVTSRLDSVTKIGDYSGPLLQTHGDADTVIPYGQGRRLFEAANEPKRFVGVPGGDHNDPPAREYLEELDRFFDMLPSQGQVRQN